MSSEYSVGIRGIGVYVPPKILTNFDLEKMVVTSDEWIKTRTGISERHIVDEHTVTSDLAVIAAQRALENAAITPEEVDLIIVCTATPDMLFPSTACIVQERLKAKNAAAFDLMAGCTSFIYGVVTGSQFLCSGNYNTVMVIGAETLSKFIDWADRSTCVLFGDGAGCVILKKAKNLNTGILAFHIGADGSGQDLLKIPAGGSKLPTSEETVKKRLHYIKMSGNEIFKFAVKIVEEATLKVLKMASLRVEDVDCFLLHQANIRIIDAAARRLKIPMEKVYCNVDRYGNTSSASVPLALAEAIQCNMIKKDSIVVMMAFGAGLTWGSIVLRWV